MKGYDPWDGLDAVHDIVLIIASITGCIIWKNEANKKAIAAVSSFQECAAKGYPVAESYPRQCRTPDNRRFVEDIGNALEKTDLIRVETPRPNATIQSPLTIKGEARGYWYIEASFPVKLFDANGNQISTTPGYIQAQADWMTENFVPFEAQIQFEAPATKKGTLILQKDNPSGLPEYDDQLKIPVSF